MGQTSFDHPIETVSREPELHFLGIRHSHWDGRDEDGNHIKQDIVGGG